MKRSRRRPKAEVHRVQDRSVQPDRRMSEILLDIADPLVGKLSMPDDFGKLEVVLLLAGWTWNAACYPTAEERREHLEDIINRLVSTKGLAPEDARALAGRLFLRARQRYPNPTRLVGEVKVTDRGNGRCDVEVGSVDL